MGVDYAAIARVRSLLEPANIVIVGASPRPGGWPERIYHNLRRFEYPYPIFLINPRYQELWGSPCYPSLAALPERPDHLVVLVPSQAALAMLQEGADHGARSATILASGFGEGGDVEGRVLGERLKALIRRTGLAVSGPNCLGNLSAPSRVVTLTDQRLEHVESGPVAIVGQSGGVVLFINAALQHRGVAVGYAISSGNEVGLDTADYLQFFANEPTVRVIVTFIESIHDASRFFAACSAVRDAGKRIVAIKIGGNEASRQAAIAHTGSLAGSLEAFDAAAREYGIIRVNNLDDAVEAVEFLAHTAIPRGPRIGVMTYSGGLRELLLESAHRQGVVFPSLAPQSEQRLREILPVGTAVGNPLDSGWGGLSSADIFFQCVDILQADPNIDVVLVQEQLPVTSGELRSETYLRGLDARAAQVENKPMAVFTMISDSVSHYGREFRKTLSHLPILQEVDKTLRIVQVVARSATAVRNDAPPELGAARPDRVPSFPHSVLNEAESKVLLRQFGIPVLNERVTSSVEEACQAAQEIGFPVVLKIVARSIPHKSDRGLVHLNVSNESAVATAFATLHSQLRPGERTEGILVSPFVQGGREVVLGVQRDPEVGLVVMFGSGGMWLELFHDVAFAVPPLNRAKAIQLVDATKVGSVLCGYRGEAAYDREAIVAALCALSDLAMACGPNLLSIDINPFLVMPAGDGGWALDALVVMRETGPE